MSTALPLTDRLRQDIRLKVSQNILDIQLNDGYREVTADGIDNIRHNYENVGWDNLDSTDRATVLSFLATVGSTGYITWTPNGFGTLRFRMTKDGWSETWSSGIHSSISFNLQEE